VPPSARSSTITLVDRRAPRMFPRSGRRPAERHSQPQPQSFSKGFCDDEHV
jgi:hypothetical protein